MRSLKDRNYGGYIVRDECLDRVETVWLLETYLTMHAYVISVEEAIGVMPNGAWIRRDQSEFNVAGIRLGGCFRKLWE
jgi:hypothetical protein